MSASEADQIKQLEAEIAELEVFKSKCRCQGPKKPKQEKKKKKNKVCKSDFVVKLTPQQGCDWAKVEADVRAIEIDGLMWATVFSLEEFVFGMKALSVGAQIEDLMVPETAPIVERLQKIEGVNAAELVNIQTAQADWGGVSSGKPKGGKKKKNKKKEEKLVITDVEIEAAANKYAMLARDSTVYAAGVEAMDRSGAMDVTEEQMRKVAEIVTKKKPDLIFILISAGKTKCSALGVIPASSAEKPGADAVAMVKSSFISEVKVAGDKSTAFAEMLCDGDKGEFAIKEKDNVMTQFFAYLNTSGLEPDDSSSEGECLLSSDEE